MIRNTYLGSTKKRIVISFLLILLSGMGIGFWVYYNLFKSNVSYEDQILYIRTGAEFEEVMNSISSMVLDTSSFRRVARLFKYDRHMKPGRYLISKKVNNYILIRQILRSGKQNPVRLALNHLSSFEDFASAVSQQLELDSLAITKSFNEVDFLKNQNITNAGLEHLIIPNTYFVYWNISPETFRDRMIQEYYLFWNKIRQEKAKKINLKPKEVSILASIVQKETSKKDEMRRIAGLYLNRLNKNWKLESDPTVLFALKKQIGKDTIIRRVLYKYLKINSPYNTYQNYGLPPTPITIPDQYVLDAVLNAESHSFMYMCASVERFGYHEFTVNGIEHERNRQKYLAWLRKKRIRR